MKLPRGKWASRNRGFSWHSPNSQSDHRWDIVWVLDPMCMQKCEGCRGTGGNLIGQAVVRKINIFMSKFRVAHRMKRVFFLSSFFFLILFTSLNRDDKFYAIFVKFQSTVPYTRSLVTFDTKKKKKIYIIVWHHVPTATQRFLEGYRYNAVQMNNPVKHNEKSPGSFQSHRLST